MDELRALVINKDFHIVAVTETWAKEDIDDDELNIDRYTVYRRDRRSDVYSKGRGIIIYVKDSLKSVPLIHLTNSEFNDSVWCQVQRDNFRLTIGVCYRSTSSTASNYSSCLKRLLVTQRRIIS